MVILQLFFTTLLIGLSLISRGNSRYRKQGCNGEVHGISCCYKGFTSGDNENSNGEKFIQANQYNDGCFQTCKKLYPDSTGITESVIQKYQIGRGTGENKCWCEMGTPDNTKLNKDNQNYRTCVFFIPDALSPSGSQAPSECLSVGGSFFGRHVGVVKALPNFKTNQNFNITLSIKPQKLTGMLVGMRGKEGFLLLELVNGEVKFKVNAYVTRFKPRSPLDDGNFHEINAIKSGNMIALQVDKQFAAPSYGVGLFPNTRTTENPLWTTTESPLFIGGHLTPDLFSTYPGSFQGCFKDVFINKTLVDITKDLVYGDVTLGTMD